MPARRASTTVAKPPLGFDLFELETFVAVAELESFSQAAEHLHVSQPSITARVKRLESALGTQLLVRTTRKVETTPEGALLLGEANAALQGLRAAVARFKDQARQARQRVVVAATPMLAALTLPPIIRDYSQRYTDVQVVLRDLQYPDALAAVEDGSADLAVLAFEGDDSRLRVEPLRNEPVVLVTPAHHALAGREQVSVDELAPHALIVVDQYQPMLARIADELARRGLQLASTTSVGNLNTLLGMLDAGMGATLLPMSMARRSFKAGHAVVRIDGIHLERSFAVVSSVKAELGTAAQSFRRFMHQAMR